jgi:hypothetical protein
LKNRIKKIENRLKQREKKVVINWIGRDDELSAEEIEKLEADGVQILAVEFVRVPKPKTCATNGRS